MGPAEGMVPAEGRGPGVWKAGALKGAGASGGGTGAGAGQVGPTDCRGGTRGWVRAAQVTRASEQKEETWGKKGREQGSGHRLSVLGAHRANTEVDAAHVAVTSRLSSRWPREKARSAQARGGGQRGEGASSRASSRR